MEDYKKEYEEALKRAKIWKEKSGMPVNKQGILDDIFPELKENKDEDKKTRESLLKYLKESFSFDGEIIYPEISNWISWLEKQTIDISSFPEEQRKYMEKYVNLDKTTLVKLLAERDENIDESLKASICDECEHPTLNCGNFPCDKVKPKFNIGDWIASDKAHEDWRVCKVINIIKDDKYIIESMYGYTGYLIPKDTSSYHIWTIKDAKNSDILAASDGSIFIFKEIVDCGCKHYIALEKDNETINVNDNLKHFWEAARAVKPATKEQRDILLQKIVEAGYIWDSEKKELMKLEQKPTWSEEDDLIYQHCLTILHDYGYDNWLKERMKGE